ncbi:hypothetical protein L9F63_003677, partial [Diploptera punctata]
MTSWYKIGQLRSTRNMLRLPGTYHKFSSTFHFPKLFTKRNLVQIIRPFMSPYMRSVSVTVHVKCVHGDAVSGSDSESDVDEIMDFYNEPETTSVRHLLYPNCQDPLMKKLNESTTVQHVFNFMREHEHEMNGKLVSQSVLVLWDLQNMYYRARATNIHPSPVISALLNPRDVIRKYVSEVNSHQDFDLLLKLVNECYQQLSVDTLSAVLLYLNKMGVNLQHDVMQNIIAHCEAILEDRGREFTLTALSRFTVTIHMKQGLWPIMISKNTLPYLISNLENCDNTEDLQLLTVCLNSVRLLLSKDILTLYRSKVEHFVDSGIITQKNSKLITKIVRFLNYPHWSYYNMSTVQKLMLVLKGSISTVAPQDLIVLHKVFQTQLEPADLMYEMHDAAANFLSQAESATIGNNPLALQGTTDLFACLVTYSSPERKSMLEKLAQSHVEESSPNTLPTLFKLLRDLKTANIQLCDAFWTKTLQQLENLPSEREDYKLFRVAHRYMHFNNNLGGTYRHYELEKQMIKWLWNEIENGTAGVLPNKFARVASFILAYGNVGQRRAVMSDSNLMELIERLLNMAPQLSKMDSLYISKGLKIASFIGHQRRNISQRFVKMLCQVDAVLNECTVRQLQEKDVKLSDINKMIKCYINRRQTQDTDLFRQNFKIHDSIPFLLDVDLTNVASNLLITNNLVPSILDKLVDYVIEVNERMLGETVAKLLYTCYILGYVPTRAKEFFQIASTLTYSSRNQDIHSLTKFRTAIALCFFQHLPENIIHFIFAVDFLERLDEETISCPSSATYPVRVRHSLMHLNRAVCLDYPETDVPWFHEKYCQQNSLSEFQKPSQLHGDVLKCLVAVTGSEQFVHMRKYSPYFYRIDFQILLNKEKKPVTVKHQTDSKIT